MSVGEKGDYLVEVRKRRGSRWFDASGHPSLRYKRAGGRSARWEGIVGFEELAALRREAKLLRLDLKATPVEYTRSSTYRRDFKEAKAGSRGPMRCRYCNAKLDEREMTVDHIVAVNLAGRSAAARKVLHLMRASDVNDPVNLAPSCMGCNHRKAAKGGLWILRGLLGRYRAYWIAVYSLAAASAMASVVLAVAQIRSLAGA